MNITIIETGNKETLSIIDPKSGMDWANDLLGNHNAAPEYDEATDSYFMSQEDFCWWSDLINRYQAADDRFYEIAKNLAPEDREELELLVQDVDLENHPEALHAACDEWESNKK